MRDSIKSWRPQPLATRASLSDEDLDRLLAVLKLRGLSEDERRKVRARISNALVWFHYERDDETRPAIHLTAKRREEIASESARRAESDPDIPAPDLKVLVPELQAMANLASGDAVTPRERRTPRGHDALTGLIYRLEKIYQDVTGRQAKLSRHPVTGEPSGPLIRFLREALLLAFWETPSDEVIAGHHQKI